MIFQTTFRRGGRSGATAAGVCGLAAGAVLLFCGAGSVPVENFTPQGAMQADLNAGGHSLTNAATVQAANVAAATVNASAGITGANSYVIYAGFHGPDNSLQLAGSRDGKNLDRLGTMVFNLPSGNCMRDDNILTQPNDTYRRPLKVGGWYWLVHTSGNFGQCSYFTLEKSHDLKNWYWVENATVTGVSGTINNVWSPDWYTPDGANFYILFQVSNQAGNSLGSPGVGYVPVTNVSAWQAGTNPTFGSYTNLGLPSGANGPFGPLLLGSAYYLFFDNGGNCHYATSSSPLSGYTDQGLVASHFQTDAGGNIESSQMVQISPTLWRFYFANIASGLVYYSEASAISGATWSAAQQIVFMDGSGIFAGCPVTLTNYDDILNALAAEASSIPYCSDNGTATLSPPDSLLTFYTGGVNTGDGNASGVRSFDVSEYGNVAYLKSGTFAFEVQGSGGGAVPLLELSDTSNSSGQKNWTFAPYYDGELQLYPANDNHSLPSNWAASFYRNGLLRLGNTVQLDGSGLQSVPVLGTDASGNVQAAALGSGVAAGLGAAVNSSGGFVTQAGGDARYAQFGASNTYTSPQSITSSNNSTVIYYELTNTGSANNQAFFGLYGSSAGAGTQPGNALLGVTNANLDFVTDNGTITGGSHTITFAAGGYNETPQLVLSHAAGAQMPVAGIGTLAITSSSSAATGSGSAALGANCPAATATAPYTWIKLTAPDGSAVYVPAWK